jgi:hypothetical protein
VQIHSEPAMTEEEVTDLDVAFLGGQVSALTLRTHDKFLDNARNLIVYKGDERIIINHRNILFYSIRKRIIRTPKPGPPKPPEPSPVDVLDV